MTPEAEAQGLLRPEQLTLPSLSGPCAGLSRPLSSRSRGQPPREGHAIVSVRSEGRREAPSPNDTGRQRWVNVT
jgi:hypothetical protein